MSSNKFSQTQCINNFESVYDAADSFLDGCGLDIVCAEPSMRRLGSTTVLVQAQGNGKNLLANGFCQEGANTFSLKTTSSSNLLSRRRALKLSA